MAFEKGVTIIELFLNTILEVHQKLCDEGVYSKEKYDEKTQVAHIPQSLFGI